MPFVFLPIAPGVVQVELERHGLVSYGSGAFLSIFIQIVFTLGIIVWLAYMHNRKNRANAFLKMSCVSKKVFYGGRWMSVERYLAENHNITVSHGMTPEETAKWLRESEEWLRKAEELDFSGAVEEPVAKRHLLVTK
jgi:hypothetical protein